MSVAENLKLMESTAAAADTRAMSMLAIAADVDGTRKRLAELKDATAASEAAQAAAETAEAAARDWKSKADDALAAMGVKVEQFQNWKTSTEKALTERTAVVANAEAAVAKQGQDLKNREADLAQRLAEHENVLARLRLHLGKADV